MVRSSAAPNSPIVACTIHGDGLTSLQYRSKPGETMKEVKFTILLLMCCNWRKRELLYHVGLPILESCIRFKKVDSIDLGSDLMAGLFVCSHNNKFSEEVEFSIPGFQSCSIRIWSHTKITWVACLR